MRRIQFLDGFRGIAVILVVLFHMNRLSFGFAGVEIFFVISGFIITLLLLEEYKKTNRIDVKQFYIRRISRIYPILFIVIISVLLISINYPIVSIQEKTWNELLFGSFHVANWYDYLHTSSYWEQGVQAPTLHLWSLGIEMQFYLIWPFLMKKLVQRKEKHPNIFNWLIIIYVLLLSLIYYLTMDGVKGVFYYNTFMRVGSFIVGGYFAYLSHKQNKPKNKKNDVVSLVCLSLFVFLTSQFELNSMLLYRLIIPIYTICIGYLFYSLYQKKSDYFLNRIVESKIIVFFGSISYSLYMVHVPIIVYLESSKVKQVSAVQSNPWMLLVMEIVLSVGVAVVLNKLVEKKIKIKTGRVAFALVVLLPISVYLMQEKSDLFKIVYSQEVIEEKWITQEPIVSKEGKPPILVVGDSWSRRTGFGMVESQELENEDSPYQILTYGMGNSSMMAPEHFFSEEGEAIYQAKTFEGYKAMWLAAIQQHQPKYVVVQFGNSDQAIQQIDGKKLRVGDTQFDQRFVSQYQEIIEFFKEQQLEIIVLNVVHNDQGHYNTMDNQLSDAMNRNIKEVAKQNLDVHFFDLEKLLEVPGKKITRQVVKDEKLFDETNHPSYTGSIYIGEQILNEVKKIDSSK